MKSIAEVVREFIAGIRQLSWLVTAEKWLRVELRDCFEAGQRIYVVLCRSVANTHVVNPPRNVDDNSA